MVVQVDVNVVEIFTIYWYVFSKFSC